VHGVLAQRTDAGFSMRVVLVGHMVTPLQLAWQHLSALHSGLSPEPTRKQATLSWRVAVMPQLTPAAAHVARDGTQHEASCTCQCSR
jgi:hypothetical protein